MGKIEIQLAEELNIKIIQVENTIKLIDEGNTIPFIARYRKEVTGGLDDSVLRDLYDRLVYLRSMELRREEITRLIEEQDKLTPELEVNIENAKTMTELEDLYRPYRPKRRTRAAIAKEKGLEPLADIIIAQEITEGDINDFAIEYINPEKEVFTSDDAVNYASDIIAEQISDNADYRKLVREYTSKFGSMETKALKKESSVYDMYYDFNEPIKTIVPHRILAINRGEKEDYLSVKIKISEEEIQEILYKQIIKNKSIFSNIIEATIGDSYKRLIAPSIEREIRNDLTEKAEEQAIKVFATNLKNLLMQPPVKDKIVMGMDPGFRTGNKIAVVDDTGKVLDTAVVYITLPHHDIEEGKKILKQLIRKHKVQIIAIGNGTGSKESEIVCAELCNELDSKVKYTIVNEAGASVYSASKLASEEFPEYDVALRSAVSIGRRLQDPLAELVKIDPKSIGVGQYQHDVNQKRLAETLEGVVESCVNSVGINLNTASAALLSYVSGISATVSKNIVIYRGEKGKFQNRKDLLKVSKLGPKTFEQCAGFLRIPDGDNILDNTGVHPESYDITNKLLEYMDFTVEDIRLTGFADTIKSKKFDISNIANIAKSLNTGIPTLKDIIKELQKPGLDPRDELPQPILRTDVMDLSDLKAGMILKGTVRNVVDFGAFVDVGVHQDGLVHISELSNKFVHHPMDVVQVGDIVSVKVLDVDVEKKRISLSMKEA